MPTIIDLGEELLVDRDAVLGPEHRLLLDALGERVLAGSPWMVIRKRVAAHYGLFIPAEHEAHVPVAVAC